MADASMIRCPICAMDMPRDEATAHGTKTGIVCPNCGTPFSYIDPRTTLTPHTVTLLLDHYEIEGTIYLSAEFSRFSDAWEALIDGSRSFIPITEAVVRRPVGDTVAHARFMEVQKSEIRGTVPKEESL